MEVFRLRSMQFNEGYKVYTMQTDKDTHDGRQIEDGGIDYPGQGYRLLFDREICQAGDQVTYDHGKEWENISACDFGFQWEAANDYPVRRKLTPEELNRKQIRLYTTCDDLGVINGAIVYATEREVASDNVREIKVDPSTGTLYVG